jgi:hypothetical protein
MCAMSHMNKLHKLYFLYYNTHSLLQVHRSSVSWAMRFTSEQAFHMYERGCFLKKEIAQVVFSII